MGLDKYLMFTKKLTNIGRWSNEFLHQRASVSEHLFSVSQIGQMLGIIEEQSGKTINWQKLYQKLLNHDVKESITGDILHVTKHKNPQVTEALELIEEQLAEELLLSHMEQPYKDIYTKILSEGKDDSIEGCILRDSDNIDALIECYQEIKLGNVHPFKEKYWFVLTKLETSSLHSTQYFLKEILPRLLSECETSLLKNK